MDKRINFTKIIAIGKRSFLYIGFALSIFCDISVADEDYRINSQDKGFQHWAAFPAIAYNAETGLLLGGLLVHFLKPEKPTDRTSAIDLLVTATTNKQYSVMLTPNLYFRNGTYHVEAFAESKYWPANYYGIGNDSPNEPAKYEATDMETKLGIERKFLNNFYIGGIHYYKRESHELEASSLFDTGVTGVYGGILSGLGFMFSYDTRDNVNDAREGVFFKYIGTQYAEVLGSDFNFTTHEVKLYKYLMLPGRSGLAVGSYFRSSRGDTPFRSLSTPDGIRVLRGLERGRFRDQDLLAFQASYRFPIAPKWGGAVFTDVAKVTNNALDIGIDEWKTSIGAGVRWALNSAERLNLRLDISYVETSPGVVLEIRDAF